MRKTTQRSAGGRHRKITSSQTTKGRIALVAVATGAVSTAGIGGAAAAQIQAQHPEQSTTAATPEIELAANTAEFAASSEAAPQILAIAEYKPVANLADQLTKAVEHNTIRAEIDQALRAPSVAKPAEGVFTSGFGPRWGTLHAGIDIANAVGTPILAVMDGEVIDSGPASGYGQWIRIRHDDGAVSVYGHMETLNVSVGQRVTAGDHIAGMGNRGFSTGSHLHFEIHPSGNGAVDPVPWFAERGIIIQ